LFRKRVEGENIQDKERGTFFELVCK